MKKSDLLKVIGAFIPLVPGGAQVQAGITALVHRDDDPTNDVEEVSAALTQIILGSVEGAESLSGKDIVNDPVLAQIAVNIQADIALFQHLLVERHGAKVRPSA